jgi:pantetheine-phosphate adenylyltransferase
MSGTPARTALFPGTFDPFTNGHLDLAERAARMFPRVVIAVAASPRKIPLFPLEERVALVEDSILHLPNVSVIGFDGLVVDCARKVSAQVMCRGIRAVSDFEFEFQMALMNRRLSPDLEVLFLVPSARYTFLNSTLVKEIARLGGDIAGLLPPNIERRLSPLRRGARTLQGRHLTWMIETLRRPRFAAAARPARAKTASRAARSPSAAGRRSCC